MSEKVEPKLLTKEECEKDQKWAAAIREEASAPIHVLDCAWSLLRWDATLRAVEETLDAVRAVLRTVEVDLATKNELADSLLAMNERLRAERDAWQELSLGLLEQNRYARIFEPVTQEWIDGKSLARQQVVNALETLEHLGVVLDD